MSRLLTEGFRPGRTMYLAFGHDEEVQGINGASIMAKHLLRQDVELEFILDEGSMIMNNTVTGVNVPVAM